MTTRLDCILGSNNPENKNKNICLLRVAEHLDVDKKAEYLHTTEDLWDAIESKYNLSPIVDDNQHSPASVRTLLKKHSDLNSQVKYYVLFVYSPNLNLDGFLLHVLLVDKVGNVIVDTDPRKSDRRILFSCHAIY